MDLTESHSLKSWLKRVVKKQKSTDIFGVPLNESLHIANTSIAYADKNVHTVIGSIPIVVAKCGAFLKDQGLYIEGIFRVSGSAKRIGDLQQCFNSSSDHGVSFDWKGYSVHDAANILRRFLNFLPEPVITHELYEPFRSVIVNETISETEKIQLYQQLIDQLPHAHQYLLFYLLDLLSLFSHHAKYTKMNSASLASVFTPGILLNPEYVMDPSHYRTSQRVVQFLIEHQEYFHLPSINVEKRRLTPTQYHQQYHQQSNEEKHLLRANTVPVKKPRFGVNDPLQIVNVKV